MGNSPSSPQDTAGNPLFDGCCDHRGHSSRITLFNSPGAPHASAEELEAEIADALEQRRKQKESKAKAFGTSGHSIPQGPQASEEPRRERIYLRTEHTKHHYIFETKDSSSLKADLDPQVSITRLNRKWKLSITVAGAKNLPKTDVLSLSGIVCCVSVFQTDLTIEPSSPVAMAVRHSLEESEEESGPRLLQGKDGYILSPQFRTECAESNVPKDLLEPQWDQRFECYETQSLLELSNNQWRRKDKSLQTNGEVPQALMLLVSVHDTQMQGEKGILGRTFLPLRLGGPMIDKWYGLQQLNGEKLTGHTGGEALINLGLSFTKLGQ